MVSGQHGQAKSLNGICDYMNGEDRRGVEPWRLLRAAGVALLCVVVAAGCAGAVGRHHHKDRQGPLSANSGSGASMYDASQEQRWVTFGANELCVHEGDAEIVLEKIAARVKVKPLKIEFWLRYLDSNRVKGINRPKGVREPFISAKGRPPNFTRDAAFAGVYTERVVGAKINTSCDERESKVSFTDLLVVMKIMLRSSLAARGPSARFGTS